MFPYVKTMACSTKFGSVLVLFLQKQGLGWSNMCGRWSQEVGGREWGQSEAATGVHEGLTAQKLPASWWNALRNCHFARWESGAFIHRLPTSTMEGSPDAPPPSWPWGWGVVRIPPFSSENVYHPANELRWAKRMLYWGPKMSTENGFSYLEPGTLRDFKTGVHC